MEVLIKAYEKPVKEGNFNYSNIDSCFKANTSYFTKDGKPCMLISGEMHYARLPKNRWKSTLLKMQALGVNVVSSYVFWNYHEEIKGQFDFTGNRDIKEFLRLCKQVKMPCILRIGPWCHAEVVYGGLPKRIQKMPAKRTNNKKYLQEVREYWMGLYNEVSKYLDGETVIGIQIDNEYYGKAEHLITLKNLAIEIGYKVPFFTMTAWPTLKANSELLPLFGGYPDAPWEFGKTALKPNNRFAIWSDKATSEIGADLSETAKEKEGEFDYIPYSTCEIGPGNQVTQHRRPILEGNACYGVGFAKFASGTALQGYYMFCGGNNPNDRLMQESRETKYPNNYPIIDYDFQAPISRYGVVRKHGKMLKLMHYFATNFDSEVCTYQAFFPKWNSKNPKDISFLKCSVRVSNNSGYFFAGSYDRSIQFQDFKDVKVTIKTKNEDVLLPRIDVKADSMFFYPFNLLVDNTKFNYILAQPIARVKEAGITVCYLKKIDGIEPSCCVDGKIYPLEIGKNGNIIEGIKLVVLEEKDALNLYLFNNSVYFLDGSVYKENNTIYVENITDEDVVNEIEFTSSNKVKLPYNKYLYSNGKRAYYTLKLPKNILENRFDVRLEFDFEGLNLQVFSGKTLINDYFNIDKKFVMHLKDYQKYLKDNSTLIVKVAPKTKYGVSNVYEECGLELGCNKLKLNSAKVVEIKQFNI